VCPVRVPCLLSCSSSGLPGPQSSRSDCHYLTRLARVNDSWLIGLRNCDGVRLDPGAGKRPEEESVVKDKHKYLNDKQ
jgi:hypothetical protein